MKGKINLKTIIIFAILILAIVLSVLGVKVAKTFMSGATADYEPQNLTAIPSADGKSATISWTTDKAVATSVLYGSSAANTPLMAIEENATTDHSVLLSILPSVATYYYEIKAGNDTFDNGGVMFTFKNKTITATPTEVPAMVPTLDPVVTLPTTSSSSSASAATGCDHATDYNKDGAKNSLDYVYCLKSKLTPTKTASK